MWDRIGNFLSKAKCSHNASLLRTKTPYWQSSGRAIIWIFLPPPRGFKLMFKVLCLTQVCQSRGPLSILLLLLHSSTKNQNIHTAVAVLCCCLIWKVGNKVSSKYTACIFRVKESKSFRTTWPWRWRYCNISELSVILPVDTASCPRKHEP
jgi:hypothetical protein